MRHIATALAIALAVPGMALAQNVNPNLGPKEGDWEVTLSGNGTSSSDFDNNSIGLSGSAGKYLWPSVLLGVRQSLNYSDGVGNDFNGATRGFADYVFDMGRFRPYVGVNFGGIYGDSVNNTLAAGPEIGLKYYADNRTFIFGQAEYQFAFDDLSDAPDRSDDGQFFYTIGVGFNF